MILHGPVLGAALGTLFTLSTLVLGTHYRHNLPLVSMQSGALGFLGAIVHTVVARHALRTTTHAPGANAGLLLGTSLAAYTLMQRVPHDAVLTHFSPASTLPTSIGAILQERGTPLFVLGYLLVFAGIFVFPVYTVAVLTAAAAPVAASTGTWVVVATLCTAALSACVSANPAVRKRIGPVNMFVAASVFSAAASVVPAYMRDSTSGLVCGAAYGIGLGAVLALHVKVTTVFHGDKGVWLPDMSARAAMMMALAGGSACAGIIVSAIVMESVQNGVQIVACVAAGCLGLGGVLIALGRWRRCRRFYVAI
ncbi:hypothetical protein BDU57DRAFT_560428 [Ampelomyces quisqualis]|uniref:Uncharacterized protein n=1 Tax=Ampelomyces quisqualis TaxID=50730 RepID=A0A6A5Q956_AMPQU|nr:hypothetical protein BDU57DRAFT_560428 [Ampelomyces quisqualis]